MLSVHQTRLCKLQAKSSSVLFDIHSLMQCASGVQMLTSYITSTAGKQYQTTWFTADHQTQQPHILSALSVLDAVRTLVHSISVTQL